MCRADLFGFTDENGQTIYRRCNNWRFGCEVPITDNNHLCEYELMAQLSAEQRTLLKFLLSAFSFNNPRLITWNIEALIIMDDMHEHYMRNREAWERFFGVENSNVLNEILMIIN